MSVLKKSTITNVRVVSKVEPVVGPGSSQEEALRNPALDVDHGEWNEVVLLKENPMRFVLFPINHDAIWHMYKKVIRLTPVELWTPTLLLAQPKTCPTLAVD